MAPTSFEKDVNEKEAISDDIEVLEQRLAAHNERPLSEIGVNDLLEQVKEYETSLRANNLSLRNHAPKDTDINAIKADYLKNQSRLSKVKDQLCRIKQTFPVGNNENAPPPPPPVQSLRLPTMDVPKFDGHPLDYMSFRDMFYTAVNNTNIPKIEKFNFLKSRLTGEAARLINAIPLTENNYDVALQALKDRYENKRELLFSTLRRLVTQKNSTPTSASSVRGLLDTTKECLRSINALNVNTEEWDPLIVFLIYEKMDSSCRQHWVRSLADKEPPQLQPLYTFLEQHAEFLQAGAGPVLKHNSTLNDRRVHSHHTQVVTKCRNGCRESHFLSRCPVFKSKSPEQRRKLIEKIGNCFNCLSDNHRVTKCSSSYTCRTCGQRHHTMLHTDATISNAESSEEPTAGTSTSTINKISVKFTQLDGEIETAPLATAVVRVSTGETQHAARAFIDPGASTGFVTQSLAQRLNLPLFNVPSSMSGLGDHRVGSSQYTTKITVAPHFNSTVRYAFSAIVVRKITGDLPFDKINRSNLHYLNGLKLADPEFEMPTPIDILLGSDFFWDSLIDGKRRGSSNQPVAQNTQFGWLVAGRTWTTPVHTFITNVQLDRSLQRFWENEEISEKHSQTIEESLCEAHFNQTHIRDDSGRFLVSIPWKSPRPTIGESKQMAMKRFLSLEKKFSNPTQKEKWNSYKAFMDEYAKLGHMEKIPPQEVTSPLNPVYYIPHHCVEKLSSTTTKLRVVFDASATTTSGSSLNSAMMVGPVLQDSLMDIMLRFRLHPIAVTADVEKMYRQIRIDMPDADLQRILWRPSPAEPIQEYRLTTVTYGTASAPYLAAKCLQQLAKDEMKRFPVAAQIALNDFYVDDVATSLPTTQYAIKAVRELRDMFKTGQFELRKWVTNDPDVLTTIPEAHRETKALIPIQHDDTPAVKTLGISWNPNKDTYQFQVNLNPSKSSSCTKRTVLSEIAQIYDPCGWLAPVIIAYKIFMQCLWKQDLCWDSALPDDLQQQWSNLRSSMTQLQQIQIPRCVSPGSHTQRSLIGYSDASELAYSAVVYVRSHYNNTTETRLLTSKTRVAPVKPMTLPRLELNGALLLSQLFKSVIHTMKIEFREVRAYTDSTIALAWIQSTPQRWKTYIRNRVTEIQENAIWNHIPGEHNPADWASRGITPTELLHHPLWWTGAKIYQEDQPFSLNQVQLQAMRVEEKPIKTMMTQPSPLHPLFSKFSSFQQFQRVTAWILRFVYNCLRSKFGTPPQSGPISSFEIRRARDRIIACVQSHIFHDDYKALSKKEPLHCKSALLSLSPFLDDQSVMRVGGRLRNAKISTNRKHPIILPRHHQVTDSIIDETHIRYLHAGPQTLLTILLNNYWIVRGKDAVRFRVKRCITCARFKATTMNQIMGDLPASRVTPSRPFLKVGVDYAGPFSLRGSGRSRIILKCWLSIFVCFATRAIHIEVVSALSTDAFLSAFRRFISRRGTPNEIYLDCGTNFKGADGVLKEFVRISQDPVVSRDAAEKGIAWKFIPAGSPHFGGLWEAGVKSVKHHLVRVMGSATLTYEEMSTLVCQIEGILNSRPLTPASTDLNDLEVLTPAHFLIGCSLTSPPEPSLQDINIGRLDRFQLVQRQREMFWKRWSSEFLTRLQQRPKWMGTKPELNVGSLVIVKDERLPPLKWKLGRIIEVHPGKDNHVRVATVKTADGVIKRSIVKLSLLPLDNQLL